MRLESKAAQIWAPHGQAKEHLVSCRVIRLCPQLMGRNWNPSIVTFRGDLLVAYNHESSAKARLPHRSWGIRIARLNDEFQPIMDHAVEVESKFAIIEDMRLFTCGRNLYGIYFEGTVHELGAGLVLVRFDDNLKIVETVRLKFGFGIRRFQKNWQCFEKHGRIHLVHSIHPHLVLRQNVCRLELVSRTKWQPDKYWLRLGGGTPPLDFEGHLISFFHSWAPWKRGSHNWRFTFHPLFSLSNALIGWPWAGAGTWPNRIYSAGAYLFEHERPFEVVAHTPRPLMTASIEGSPDNAPACVFPCGACWYKGAIMLSYGYNDEECRIALYDPRILLRQFTSERLAFEK